MANEMLTRSPLLTNHITDPSNATFFNGSVATGTNTKDPFVSGYAFIKWIKVPRWIGTDDGRAFKQLTERNFKSFSGLNDLELETGAVTSGFTGNETMYAKGTMQKPSSFSLKYQMKSGYDIDSYYETWTSGIRDPRTGIATYPKQTGLPYHSSNHTGVLLYVVTRPDADNFGKGGDGSNIERAFLWTNVMPTKIILNPYNFEAGSHEFYENEQEFKGYMNFGATVDQFAAQQMAASNVYQFFNENNMADIGNYMSSIPSKSPY